MHAHAHPGDDVGVVGVDAGVVEADGGGLDGPRVQLQRAEVERDARVGRRVLQRVEPRAVGGLVEDVVALDCAMQDEALLAPAGAKSPLGVRGVSRSLWLGPCRMRGGTRMHLAPPGLPAVISGPPPCCPALGGCQG